MEKGLCGHDSVIPTTETATAAGATHPTGMHTCTRNEFFVTILICIHLLKMQQTTVDDEQIKIYQSETEVIQLTRPRSTCLTQR